MQGGGSSLRQSARKRVAARAAAAESHERQWLDGSPRGGRSPEAVRAHGEFSSTRHAASSAQSQRRSALDTVRGEFASSFGLVVPHTVERTPAPAQQQQQQQQDPSRMLA